VKNIYAFNFDQDQTFLKSIVIDTR